ncbi:MAG: ComEA family DNA-binding protein [Desertifilum sp. SIO1I2]|nr:ComEA family DNA-binding protein [Desertifilum sp. SIO1I2]
MSVWQWLSGVAQMRSLRAKIQGDRYYRLQSLSELAIAVELGWTLDVNQATVDDWLRLPGLSIHQARSLWELSRAGVQFFSIEDIAAALSVPVTTLQPLEPALSFCYYPAEQQASLNPNSASVEALLQVPGMDRTLAEAIVQNRQTLGNYRDLSDFQRRLALPGSQTSQLMHYLRFS